MHVVVLFHNIGGYHAARLRAAHVVCLEQGWLFTAIQETDYAQEHPWGDLEQKITFPLKTLLPSKSVLDERDRDPQSTVAASRLPACLDKLSPDVLFIPGWGYPNSRAALKWAKQHHRIAILMSESKANDVPRVWWKEKLKSLFYIRKFKAALVGGHLHRDYLAQLGFPQKGIFFGYDIVDNDYFSHRAQKARQNPDVTRRQYQIPPGRYFITVSRFIPRKNILRLIDAFAEYRKASALENPLDLVICGSGAEEENIRSRVSKYQLESSVHLPGFKSYEEMPEWFGLADAFIHPALSEQWGLVVNEALASGLPVLVSNRCGCFSELVHEGENGFGFAPENVAQLAHLMLKISEGSIDRDAMKQSAFKYIQDFSLLAFGKGFKQAIEYAFLT